MYDIAQQAMHVDNFMVECKDFDAEEDKYMQISMNFRGNVKAKEQAARALGNLAFNNEENKNIIADATRCFLEDVEITKDSKCSISLEKYTSASFAYGGWIAFKDNFGTHVFRRDSLRECINHNPTNPTNPMNRQPLPPWVISVCS